MENQEIWKEIPETNGNYSVSNFGRVRSLGRINRNNRRIKGGVLKNTKTHYGYLVVSIYEKNIKKLKRVHVLLANAFIPNPYNKLTVNHKDGNKSNNHIDNLEWATMKEQNIHSYQTGLKVARKGENHYRSSLVLNMETGIFYESLKIAAKTYNVNYSTAKKWSKTNKLNLKFV